ncbi:MAG: alpha/beta hydrolase [Gammaproteobacteria bacterium]
MTHPVYRNYDQQSLDAQYNNRARFPNFSEHFDRWAQWSQRAREQLPAQLDVAFGSSEKEKLDIFPAADAGAPLYVFIHGGYWYSLDKSQYSFVAEGMRPHGITTAVTNFALAPAADMDTIVEHNRRALAWLWNNATRFGADPGRIYICGHSAGGHLGVMLLGTEWARYGAGLPVDLVKGVCAIGGIFDMEPIRLSYLNNTLHLDAAQAQRNCPLHQTYRYSAPLSLIVAADESPEFQRQSRDMQAHWQSLGYPVELLVPAGLDHFNVVNDLADPGCALVMHQLEQMKLAFKRN